MQVGHRDLLVGADRDDLLREHVERVARDRRSPRSRPRASLARRPRTRAGRRGTSGRCGPSRRHPSSCPARPTRCRPRATDFGLSTWITRSTAPMSMPSSRLEVATRHGMLPGLEQLLDLDPLLARERAVVRARSRCLPVVAFAGELVEPQRQPLGEPAVVDEHDRRAVLRDELEQRGVDRRPDRACASARARRHLDPVGGSAGCEVAVRAELAHVLDRDDDLEVELLARPGVDELDRHGPPGDEAADLLERPLRGRQADALERRRDDALEALEREREVGAALGPGDGVHLVEDHASRPCAASRAPAR